MPRIERTLMPPSLRATGVTKKGPNPHIKTLPRKPSKLQTQDCRQTLKLTVIRRNCLASCTPHDLPQLEGHTTDIKGVPKQITHGRFNYSHSSITYSHGSINYSHGSHTGYRQSHKTAASPHGRTPQQRRQPSKHSRQPQQIRTAGKTLTAATPGCG